MLNILHLERKFTAQTETFIVNQINTLKELKHSVFTVKELNLLSCNATVYSPETLGSTKFLGFKDAHFFYDKLQEVRPDIIHSHFLTDARFFLRFTKKIKNVPKICSCYGYDVSRFPKKFGFLARLYLRPTFKDYDFFLAMSEDMKRDLISIGCPEGKIIIHYHGIETSKFFVNRSYQKKEQLHLLTIGSLVEKKGHMTVLKALKYLKTSEQNLNLKYIIIGNGVLRAELEEFVKRNGLSDSVFFMEGIKHGDKFNRQLELADVFIHPSLTTKHGDKEGIPGTIVEAMASGLPVISTIHAGIPEVIKQNYNGLLIKEADHIALSESIRLLYKDYELRKFLGGNAYTTANDKLSINIRKENLRLIYTDAIKNYKVNG